MYLYRAVLELQPNVAGGFCASSVQIESAVRSAIQAAGRMEAGLGLYIYHKGIRVLVNRASTEAELLELYFSTVKGNSVGPGHVA